MNKRDTERKHRRLRKEWFALNKRHNEIEDELFTLALAACPFKVGDEITYQPDNPQFAFSGVVSRIESGGKKVWILRARKWLNRPHKSGRKAKTQSLPCVQQDAIRLVRRPA